MLRTSKPRNARSKRALEARAPREHEAAKKAIFVRGPHSSDKVALAFRDLAALKKPDAIQFAKKNDCLPFEEAGASSLEFWAGKNDTSLFVVGNTQKKRKDNLAFARIFDGHVLDIIEMGVLEGKGISEFKVSQGVTPREAAEHCCEEARGARQGVCAGARLSGRLACLGPARHERRLPRTACISAELR